MFFPNQYNGSQKSTSLANGGIIVTLQVIPNFELEGLILSFGERVKVMEPEGLKEIIFKRTSACFKLNNV